MAAKKPVLFGLTGTPLYDRIDVNTEVEAATSEEALEIAKIIQKTPYLRVLEFEEHFLVLVNVGLATRGLFNAYTADDIELSLNAGISPNVEQPRDVLYIVNEIPGYILRSTPLFPASACGRTCVVERLLAAGADVNAATSKGWTPLHAAARKGHLDVVKILLAAGADTNARTRLGQWTPLRMASENGHSLVAKLLRAAGAQE